MDEDRGRGEGEGLVNAGNRLGGFALPRSEVGGPLLRPPIQEAEEPRKSGPRCVGTEESRRTKLLAGELDPSLRPLCQRDQELPQRLQHDILELDLHGRARVHLERDDAA